MGINTEEIFNGRLDGLPAEPSVREAWKPYVENDLNGGLRRGLQKTRDEVDPNEVERENADLAEDIIRTDLAEIFHNEKTDDIPIFEVPRDRIHYRDPAQRGAFAFMSPEKGEIVIAPMSEELNIFTFLCMSFGIMHKGKSILLVILSKHLMHIGKK